MPDKDQVLFEEVEASDGYKFGRITLNSPETLNSLTLSMINSISPQLDKWAQKEEIICIILESIGDRAFCAGGDIRALYESMVKHPGGPNPFAEKFFESEYRLDYQIHTYPKPVICWINGIAMGGGVGLMLGCDFKLSTENTRFAMPEIGVGLFPDVGFTYYISKLPKNIGLYMMLTSTQLNASDTQSIGLTDSYISSADKGVFENELKELNWSLDADVNKKLIQSSINEYSNEDYLQVGLPETKLEPRIDLVQKVTNANSLLEVVNNIENLETKDNWFLKGKEGLKKGSPTSAYLIWEQCQRSGHLSLEEVFQFELDLAIQVTRHQDFTEGIRAIIIDKDNDPKWVYTKVEDVTTNWIDEHLKPAWKQNPLKNLGNN